MTHDSLANALGASPQTVSKWETGTTMPDIMLLPVIAEVFDTDINTLFGSKPEHERRNLTRQNLCEEMHGNFLKSLSCFFLGFVNEESYEIRDFTFALPCSMDGIKYELQSKAPYRFEGGAERCIVMVGKSAVITVRTESGRKEIVNYDTVPEGRFFFGDRFLAYLKETF